MLVLGNIEKEIVVAKEQRRTERRAREKKGEDVCASTISTSILLYCKVLYYTVLYCTVLHYTLTHCTVM